MFHMMIYMYKKAGNFDQARKLFRQMAESGIPRSTVTFNSLMSFETDYKEVSKIYDQVFFKIIYIFSDETSTCPICLHLLQIT